MVQALAVDERLYAHGLDSVMSQYVHPLRTLNSHKRPILKSNEVCMKGEEPTGARGGCESNLTEFGSE